MFRISRAIQDIDVSRLINRLRVRNSLPEKEVLTIYEDFVSNITTEEQILEVRLCSFSPSHSDLFF